MRFRLSVPPRSVRSPFPPRSPAPVRSLIEGWRHQIARAFASVSPRDSLRPQVLSVLVIMLSARVRSRGSGVLSLFVRVASSPRVSMNE